MSVMKVRRRIKAAKRPASRVAARACRTSALKNTVLSIDTCFRNNPYLVYIGYIGCSWLQSRRDQNGLRWNFDLGSRFNQAPASRILFSASRFGFQNRLYRLLDTQKLSRSLLKPRQPLARFSQWTWKIRNAVFTSRCGAELTNGSVHRLLRRQLRFA